MEREAEVVVLSDRLSAARQGSGGVVFVEAPLGRGKSQLLRIAGDLARRSGLGVLAGKGTQLEQHFPYGVAVQLFEPCWLAAGPEDRPRLLAGPARWAGELLAGSLPEGADFQGDRGYPVIHGLYWLLRHCLAEPIEAEDATGRDVTGLALLVDDVHWADRPSLRFLAYLADRIAELPVLLVVAAGPGETTTDSPALMALRGAAGDAVLRPRPLSEPGVTAIVQSQLPDAEPAFCRAVAEVTNGNPLLAVALVEHVRSHGAIPDAETAGGLAGRVPESVLGAVRARLAAIPAEAVRVASAVAVLGEGASLGHTAELADLDIEATSRAADTLASLDLLHPGAPLSFVHPLVDSAVRATMSPLELGQSHRRAASILSADGAPPERIGAHLLFAPPSSDARATEVLRAAARYALANGEAARAAQMLERALAEGAPTETYAEVLAELGQAELAAGFPDAARKLDRAISLTGERSRRTELALTHGWALHAQSHYREAAGVLAAALDEVDEQSLELAGELEAAYIASASFVPELVEQVRTRGRRMLGAIGDDPSPGQRDALAHLASLWSVRGDDRSTILSLAEGAGARAGELDRPGGADPIRMLLATALTCADELELALELCEDADDPAAGHPRAWALYEQGHVAEARAVAEATLHVAPAPWQAHARTAPGALAACHIEREALAQAEVELSIIDRPEAVDTLQLAFLLDVRAQLRLAQRRPDEALADALEAGRRSQAAVGEVSPGALAWRSTAAFAYLAAGDRASAERLAGEELELARAASVTRVVIRDLRVLGLAARGGRRLDLLSEAVNAGEDYPPRLEHTRALIDLGAALRRANHRAAAREPLRRGLERSHRGGATVLAERASDELAATGARPRRATFTGVDALTPSERRVADLAADGLTTREVAKELFVTPKTVEFHLNHIYRKLGVRSRPDLTRLMEEHRANGGVGDGGAEVNTH